MREEMTVGELKRLLSGWHDDTKVSFDSGMTFNRLKRCSGHGIVLVFNEFQAELSKGYLNKFPNILTVFCKPDTFENL